MKTFLITITILGAIIYGMLEINEYYDDRGACSWGLLDGGYYLHKERLDNAIKGLTEDIIKRDKNARKELWKNQGLNEKEITKKIKALEPQYQKEREKMVKYCYVDFDKTPFYNENINGYTNPTEYCEIGHGNNSGDAGYISYSVKYNFDKESMKFFNLERLIGIEYDTMYYPCDTRYQGLGETGNFVVK